MLETLPGMFVAILEAAYAAALEQRGGVKKEDLLSSKLSSIFTISPQGYSSANGLGGQITNVTTFTSTRNCL